MSRGRGEYGDVEGGDSLPAAAVLVASRSLLGVDLGDEKVLLDMDSATYFGLDPISSRILDLLDVPRSIAEICATLEVEYAVASERCVSEVTAVLNDMLVKGIVNRAASGGTTRPAGQE